ncbi:tRNA (guanosine(37)-N1)-methyltransferase TrmD [Roseospira visakhapatnamensis]|uniref:tRNA (guanine-N(1)-)-methyltransferase n=1 Tax=Roseospira visakhapatnamensis TaxID=390880 RepID=A0A7W6RBX2_9PROT|nr:tRNA (guanosine(37)-N1)-methyltransferase TrmD [Roseospira visakhapatnamensis]MBB4265575.1 tRNA (guanine37-N1)-methyltransferase [Roseospira visakhapatnamensis]
MTEGQRQAATAEADPWTAVVLTLFPGMFPGMLGHSLAGKALADGRWTLEAVDIRAFARDRHGTVDDSPYGGGAGMVMRPDVVSDAIAAHHDPAPGGTGGRRLIYPSPRGRVFDQAMARDWAAGPGVTLVCGRYEGLDQRVIDAWAEKGRLEEVSLGDFVLSGGEPAALVMLDAVVRLLPGVMGAATSLDEESFERGLLEYPHYTRPPVWDGRAVPEVLVSGHHERVATWRLAQAEAITRNRRPDLWARYKTERA